MQSVAAPGVSCEAVGKGKRQLLTTGPSSGSHSMYETHNTQSSRIHTEVTSATSSFGQRVVGLCLRESGIDLRAGLPGHFSESLC